MQTAPAAAPSAPSLGLLPGEGDSVLAHGGLGATGPLSPVRVFFGQKIERACSRATASALSFTGAMKEALVRS